MFEKQCYTTSQKVKVSYPLISKEELEGEEDIRTSSSCLNSCVYVFQVNA